jgi:hypothetical protein
MTAIQLPGNSKYRRDGRFQMFDAGAKIEEGYRLHIAATQDDAQRVARAVLPLLCEQTISHKVVADTDMVSGDQEKKFITVYPRSNEQARTILDRVSSALTHLEGGRPRPIGADSSTGTLSFGSSSYVSMGYGEGLRDGTGEERSQLSSKLFEKEREA